MKRLLLLGAGLAIGVLVSGVAVGILVPAVPDRWRSAGLVWGSAAVLVGACIGLALLLSRPRRE